MKAISRVLILDLALVFGQAIAAEIPVGETVDGVYHPDWAALVEGNETPPVKDTVVPAGETWIAYESDMAFLRQIGRLRAQKGGASTDFRFSVYGTLIVEDTTTWFGTTTLAPRGGTIVKRGATTVNANVSNWNFGKLFVIEAGTVVWQDANALGNQNSAAGATTCCDIEVRNGATLALHFEGKLGNRTVRIAGTGDGGAGAIWCKYRLTEPFKNLVLADDALVSDDGSNQLIGGTVDLAGHTLTIGGTHATVPLTDMVFANPGGLVVNAFASGVRTVQVSGTTDMADGLTVALGDGTRLLLPAAMQTVGAAIVANGAASICSAASAELTFAGELSGAGSFAFGDPNYPAKGVWTLLCANTWTGGTSVRGDSAFLLRLMNGGAMPDFSRLDVYGGKLEPVPGYDDNGALRWTPSQLLSFSKCLEVTASARTISYGTTELTGDTRLVFPADVVESYFPDLDVKWNATGTGSGSYTLTGPYAPEKPLVVDQTGGAIRLSGAETISLGDVTVGGAAPAGATLVLDDAADVVFGETILAVGAKAASATTFGRLVVTNSVLRSTYCEENIGEATKAKGHLWIGSHARGLLSLEAGGVISNKVYTGGGGYGQVTSGSGVGAIYQRGGVFAPVVNSQSYVSTSLGMAGFGYYQIEDGVVHPWGPGAESGWFAVGAYGGAVFVQNGGEVDLSQVATLTVGANGGGFGEYCVRRGRTTAKALYSAMSGGAGRGVITVDGPEAEIVTTANTYFNFYPDKSTIVNLNRGGLLQINRFGFAHENNYYTAAHPTVVNFNGGVLKALYRGSVFGSSAETCVSKALVFEDGATIENPSNADTMYTPLEGAGAGGIQSIALSAPVEGILAPNVTITGDGEGATAIAEFDVATQTVTGILVTSRGWGYTQAGTTIVLRDGLTDVKTLSADEFAVGANQVGGFTKKGAGVLSLYNTNTWARWTKVLDGTLRVMVEGAVPSGTALTLDNGATLDLGNVEPAPRFSSLSGAGGTVAGGALKLVGEVSLSARHFSAEGVPTIAGAVDLSEATELRVTEADAVTADDRSSVVLLETTEPIAYPAGGLSVEGIPVGLRVRCGANRISLGGTGFILLVR